MHDQSLNSGPGYIFLLRMTNCNRLQRYCNVELITKYYSSSLKHLLLHTILSTLAKLHSRKDLWRVSYFDFCEILVDSRLPNRRNL